MSIQGAFHSLRWKLAKHFALTARGTQHGGMREEDFIAADHAINAMSNADLLAALASHEWDTTND